MRALLLSLLLLGTGVAAHAQGVSSGTVQITVSLNVNRSFTVDLQGGSTSQYVFGGSSLPAQVNMTTAAFRVVNVGDMALTYVLQITSEADTASPPFPWTSQESTASVSGLTNRYRLLAMFDATSSGITDITQFLVKRLSATSAGTGVSGQFARNTAFSGAAVTANPAAAGNERLLFFDLVTPGYTTSSSEKRVSVTLSAQ